MSAALALANHYFELSNARDLDAIGRLFTASSTYSSVHTGVYLGAADIMAMQRGFFAAHHALHWAVLSVEEIRPQVCLFDFALTGATMDGDAVVGRGHEYVVVYDSRLQHVEVRTHPEDA
ncbi:MAG: nuclear transport factor 2 family protein [Pseudomonadota bacterium]